MNYNRLKAGDLMEIKYNKFNSCNLCPRRCNVNRNNREIGFCGASNFAEVNRIGLHFMEEPVISGKNGSGTVFFTHCTLGCIYCQNFKISRSSSSGKKYSADELAKEFLKLEAKGAHNINLVSPTHYQPIIIDACNIAKNSGLKIPFVYNTSGFELAERINELSGIIDIFLTDLKYVSPYLSDRYSKSADYFDYAIDAIDKMLDITGRPQFSNDGMLKQGVIIRHLILPSQVADALSVLQKIANRWSDRVLVSLMRQYTPINSKLPDSLNRTVSDEEYLLAIETFEALGLEGFIQGKESVGEEKIPNWNLK